MNYTKDGVPVISDEDIEKTAYSILSSFDPEYLVNQRKIPILGLLDHLSKTDQLKFALATIHSPGPKRTLGYTLFLEGKIYVEKELILTDEPLFLSTAAHELGHWVLHRHRPIMDDGIKQEKLDETEETISVTSQRRELKTNRDWIEHHAKVFAANLLMPRISFVSAMVGAQKELGLSRNFGHIYITDSPGSMADYLRLLEKLQNYFGTSKQSIEIRIKETAVLVDQRKKSRIAGRDAMRCILKF